MMPEYVTTNGLAQPELLSELMTKPVHVTELLDGALWEATITRPESFNRVPQVTERCNGEPYEGDIIFTERIDFFLDALMTTAPDVVETITVRGVLIGSNCYGRTMPEIRLFDIEVNGEAVTPDAIFLLFAAYGQKAVPVLSAPGQTLEAWLSRRAPETAAKGNSRLWAAQRKGVVIRPIGEQNHPDVGRLVLKLEALDG